MSGTGLIRNHDREVNMIKFQTNPSDSNRITSRYGNRLHPIKKVWRFHWGIDIGKRPLVRKEYIYAVLPGKVITQGWNSERGNYVVIQHEECATLYQHLASYITKIDQNIEAAEVIGVMGKTGASKGIHLHFELYKGRYLNADRINPEPYLRKE